MFGYWIIVLSLLLHYGSLLGCPVTADPSKYLAYAQKKIRQGKLIQARYCLENAIKKFPKNRDLAFQLTRVYAWQKQHSKASKLFSRFDSADPESIELNGDLFWYKNNLAKAGKYYLKYLRKFGFTKMSLGLVEKTVTAFKHNRKKMAIKVCHKALKKFPDNQNLGELCQVKDRIQEKLNQSHNVKPARKFQPLFTAATSLRKGWQSEQQGEIESLMNLTWKGSESFSLGLQHNYLERDFGTVQLSDRSAQINGAFHHKVNQYLSFSMGYAPNSQLYAKNLQILGWGVKNGFFDYYIEVKNISYQDIAVKTIGLTSSYTGLLPYYAKMRIMLSSISKDSPSFLINLRYVRKNQFVEIYTAWGVDESKRSYLTGTKYTNFQIIGLKGQQRFHPDATIFAYLENEHQNKFQQITFGLGIFWDITTSQP